MRASVRDFMLPDFLSFRKGQCDRASAQLSNPNADNASSAQQNSKHFDKSASQQSQPHFSARLEEPDNRFARLYPHRHDFIYAPHPDPGCKPQWKTESRYPLSDRKLVQGSFLYGVRHGKKATYAFLDLDKGSPYHPSRDPLAADRILAELEPLGFVAAIATTSSDSKGLHFTLPCDEPVPSHLLGAAITVTLENAGFKVAPGILEVFPNRKPYVEGVPTLFNAHRLPLQQGSYLLDDDLNPVSSSQLLFYRRWRAAQKKNAVSVKTLKLTLKQKVRYCYKKVTGNALKFLGDLNSEIEVGWTGKGQTNYLLGRIVMRTYIFGHVINAVAPLTGRALADEAERIARSLPGFDAFCGHRHDLRKRICEWVRSIAKSHYFPYSNGKPLAIKEGPTWNEEQKEAARSRIRNGLLDLIRGNALPDGVGKRARALSGYGVSVETLYRHKDLWHPKHLDKRIRELIDAEKKLAELNQDQNVEAEASSAEGADASTKARNLLGAHERNSPNDKGASDPSEAKTGLNERPARNSIQNRASSDSDLSNSASEVVRSPAPKQLALNIQWALQLVRERQQANSQASRAHYRAQKLKQAAAEHLAKLKAWAASGDPVLVNEANVQLERLGGPI